MGFTSKYNINRFVYYEQTNDVQSAIAHEKAIKGWLRAKKIALVESINPVWQDLSEEWHEKADFLLLSELLLKVGE